MVCVRSCGSSLPGSCAGEHRCQIVDCDWSAFGHRCASATRHGCRRARLRRWHKGRTRAHAHWGCKLKSPQRLTISRRALSTHVVYIGRTASGRALSPNREGLRFQGCPRGTVQRPKRAARPGTCAFRPSPVKARALIMGTPDEAAPRARACKDASPKTALGT